jgi:hypothetical protein
VILVFVQYRSLGLRPASNLEEEIESAEVLDSLELAVTLQEADIKVRWPPKFFLSFFSFHFFWGFNLFLLSRSDI